MQRSGQHISKKITWHPPIKHGDLFGLTVEPGDVVVIIDGHYHQEVAVRHKEIMWLRSRGIWIVGAASLGALRAAELAPIGAMVGIGAIYQQYITSPNKSDADVAVAEYSSAADYSTEDVAARSTIPIVDIEAMSANLSATEKRIVDTSARSMFYAYRTLDNLCETLPALLSTKLQSTFTDKSQSRKRLDADEALEYASSLLGTSAPALDLHFDRDVNTAYVGRWRNSIAAQQDQIQLRIDYQRLFSPLFVDTWRRYVDWRLRNRSGPGPTSIEELTHHLFPHVAKDQGAGLTLSVTIPEVDLTNHEEVRMLLENETDVERAHVERVHAFHAELLRRRPELASQALRRSHLDDALQRNHLSDQAQRSRRGFRSGRSARSSIEPFAAYELLRRSV